jgi:hypothetical protein
MHGTRLTVFIFILIRTSDRLGTLKHGESGLENHFVPNVTDLVPGEQRRSFVENQCKLCPTLLCSVPNKNRVRTVRPFRRYNNIGITRIHREKNKKGKLQILNVISHLTTNMGIGW